MVFKAQFYFRPLRKGLFYRKVQYCARCGTVVKSSVEKMKFLQESLCHILEHKMYQFHIVKGFTLTAKRMYSLSARTIVKKASTMCCLKDLQKLKGEEMQDSFIKYLY